VREIEVKPTAIRAWRAATLLCVVAVATVNLFHLGATIPAPPTTSAPAPMVDYVSRSERRFAAFRQAAQERGISGTIGYVQDLSGSDPDWPDFEPDYFVAQFVLLPLVLDSNLERNEWALGNFRPSSPPTIPAAWRVVQDCGGGVVLLRNTGQ
jgi:hypothetical protein